MLGRLAPCILLALGLVLEPNLSTASIDQSKQQQEQNLSQFVGEPLKKLVRQYFEEFGTGPIQAGDRNLEFALLSLLFGNAYQLELDGSYYVIHDGCEEGSADGSNIVCFDWSKIHGLSREELVVLAVSKHLAKAGWKQTQKGLSFLASRHSSQAIPFTLNHSERPSQNGLTSKLRFFGLMSMVGSGEYDERVITTDWVYAPDVSQILGNEDKVKQLVSAVLQINHDQNPNVQYEVMGTKGEVKRVIWDLENVSYQRDDEWNFDVWNIVRDSTTVEIKDSRPRFSIGVDLGGGKTARVQDVFVHDSGISESMSSSEFYSRYREKADFLVRYVVSYKRKHGPSNQELEVALAKVAHDFEETSKNLWTDLDHWVQGLGRTYVYSDVETDVFSPILNIVTIDRYSKSKTGFIEKDLIWRTERGYADEAYVLVVEKKIPNLIRSKALGLLRKLHLSATQAVQTAVRRGIPQEIAIDAVSRFTTMRDYLYQTDTTITIVEYQSWDPKKVKQKYGKLITNDIYNSLLLPGEKLKAETHL